MFKANPITFNLEGVKGNITLEQGFLGQPKLYQDGQLLKKQGFFKAKYPVVTDNGQGELIELRRGLSFAYSIIHRGKEIKLEESLSPVEYVLGVLPLILLIILGGVLGALIGLVGVTLVINFMRSEKRLYLQAIVAGCTMLACWLLYLLIVFILSSLIHG